MNRILHILAVIIILFSACNSKDRKVTNWKDYSKYLLVNIPNKKLSQIDDDIIFWNKRFIKTPDDLTSRIKIAGLFNRRFQYSGDIQEIKKADSIYFLVAPLMNKSGSGIYRSLAANCITQHKFKQADLYLDSALRLGDNLSVSKLQKFDVDIELGNLDDGYKILQSFKEKNSFEYLTRYAKYLDHTGHLDNAILHMEKALSLIEDDENGALYCWTKSNLGDMYGHANRFAESYHAYLDVLIQDPEYYHALKGIAWLAFSHDKDTTHASAILQFLQEKHPVPDYKLILSQVSAFENNLERSNNYSAEFIKEVSQDYYGDMYNKYLFYLATDHNNDFKEALRLAEREVSNRPTPESYNLLCWALYKSGNIEQAALIAKKYVENKCFEPDAIYHLGIIYKAVGDFDKARKYLTIAQSSLFELGPYYQSQIRGALQNL